MKGVFLGDWRDFPEGLPDLDAGGNKLVQVQKINDCLLLLQRDLFDFLIIHSALLRNLGMKAFSEFMEATFYIPTVIIGSEKDLPEATEEVLQKRILLQFSADSPEAIKAAIERAFRRKETADQLQNFSFRLRVMNILGV